MSLAVFLLCCAMLFLSFYIARLLPALFNNERLMLPLTFLGRNSLLYLYVHFPLILLIKHFRIVHRVDFLYTHPYLVWAIALAAAYLGMFILLPIARIKWFGRLFDMVPTWVVMIALVFGVGFFVRNLNIEFLLEVALGLVTALFFSHLSATLKQQVAPA
jgi:hypothetical protein